MGDSSIEILPVMVKVLSIQSHVVSGYVGNRAAVFPLQLLGFDTDYINSVQFSNHTQYPTKKGKVLDGAELGELTEALLENRLLDHNYLLTGYIGSDNFLSNVLELLTEMESTQPDAKYVCDPVLGDHGRYYVPAELVDIFRERVIPRAYMITPNQFEAELLTGKKIRCEQDAIDAVVSLLRLGPKIVVLTSAEFDPSPEAPQGKLFCYCAKKTADPEKLQFVRVVVDKIDGHFTGTGDCTAALMLAWVDRTSEDIGTALLHSMASLQGILKLTKQQQIQNGMAGGVSMSGGDAADPVSRARHLRFSELAVIRGKKCIEEPPVAEFQLDLQSWEVKF